MATLKAMFKLYDGYSPTVDKINRKTDQAIDKILKASGSTDKFNKKLESTGASANIANSGLGKLVKTFISLAAVKKGMDITDNYANTNARLSLINDGLQTQLELQDKIFAAADRSRGSYSEMASAISKMGLMASKSFGSNDELIAFTELMQKSFKVGGAETSEQQGAMRQLTQAMASGRLQGDEFTSISENAPLIAGAIETYMHDVLKMKGTLKDLSSDGLISAGIIKNALFMAGDEINSQFETLPMTFADIWTKIGRESTKAFRPVMESVSRLINADGFQNFINGILIGVNMLASDIEWLINLIVENWGIIGPILGAVASYYLVSMISSLSTMIPLLMTKLGIWSMLQSPIFLVVLAIGLVISILHSLGVTFEDVFGFVGGIVGTFVGYFYNGFVYMWNAVAAFVNFVGNAFRNPVSSIQILFYDLMVNVLGYIETMAKGIEDVINKIPGVNVDITSGLTGFKNKIKDASATIKDESGFIEYVKTKEFMDYSDAYTKGSGMGKDLSNSIGDAIGSLTNKLTGKDLGFDSSKAITVEGIGKNKKVKVDMDDEDLKYLRDMAERDYINKFSTATLAPNIEISFGDVHEEADANKLVGRIKKILQEEIATAAEGAY